MSTSAWVVSDSPKPPSQSAHAGASSPFERNRGWANPGPYTTKLSPSDESKFQQWVKAKNVPWQDTPTADYDMRGYYKALQSGDQNAKQQKSGYDGTMHFPDTYKTPYHATFSNESRYATKDAPRWSGDILKDKNGNIVADETPKNANGGWTVSDSPTPPQPDLTDNPNGEGVYQMRDHSGKAVQIPYSNVSHAFGKGMHLANQQEVDRFLKDFSYDREQNDPYQQKMSVTPGGVIKGALNEGKNAAKGAAGLFAPPKDAGEAVLGPALPVKRMAEGYIDSAGKGLHQAGDYFEHGQPVRGAATALGAVNPLSSGPTASINERADSGAPISDVIGQGLADSAMIAAPELAKAVVPKIPAVAEKTAGGIMNRTVGALKGDFARGANPGRGYVRSGAGPAGSMEGLAGRAGDALDTAGDNLGKAYDGATATGTKIPAADVQQAIDNVIKDAKNSAQGPGVMADPAVYDELRKTFDPSLQSAQANGGFTPRELWDIRRNMDRNLNWGDQSKLNLTKVQQRASGAIGGVLEDHIPELSDLNQQYQDLSKFSNRAEQRALTHQSSLTGLARKASMAGGGALVGAATHSPGWEMAGAAAGAVADSVPFKSAMATGINAAGKASKAVAPVAGEATLPVSLAAVSGNRGPEGSGHPDQKDDTTDNQDPISQKVEQSNPPEPQSKTSIPPDVHPDSHVFSVSQWRQGNPDGDEDEARQAAGQLGYEVVK